MRSERTSLPELREPSPNSPEFAGWLRKTMTREDFDGLPEDDVEALRRFATTRTCPPGATLFRQGERPREIFIIERGDLELVYETRFERLVVQFLHAGSTVDDLAVILDVPYSYSAVTLTDASVLCLRLDTIRALEELFPEISYRWLRLMAHTLERAHRRLLELAGKSAVEQVVHFLVHESAARQALAIDLTQGELAATLALSRQTVSRVLRDLAREHAVKRERRRVLILDHEKLQAHLPR
jgi:CRP/FNR family transcriptional regulator, cyclic AMP receptor protein